MKIGLVIIYNKRYLNKKQNMMRFMKINGKIKKMNGYLMLKMTYYQLFPVMLDVQRVWKY